MEAVTAVAVAAAVIMAVEDIISVVEDAISVAGIMAAAIFTAGRRISVRSPAIVHSPRAVRSRHTVRSPRIHHYGARLHRRDIALRVWRNSLREGSSDVSLSGY